MARYTVKIFCRESQVERFEHRSKGKLKEILSNRCYHRAGETSPFGDIENHPDRFEVFDAYMEKLHSGDIAATLAFIGTLK